MAVERAGRTAPGDSQRGRGHAPTLGHPAARSLSGLAYLGIMLAILLAGAVCWALVIAVLIEIAL